MRRTCVAALTVLGIYVVVSTRTIRRHEPFFYHKFRHDMFAGLIQVFPHTRVEYGIMQFDRTPRYPLSFIYYNTGERKRVNECETPRNWLLA